MTRRHVEALAAALKTSKPSRQFQSATLQWRKDVRAIATVLLAHNPRFDTRRFYAACGYETTESTTTAPTA